MLSLVKKIEYSSIIESDHAPLILDLSLLHKSAEYTPWRLDTSLLKEKGFCQMISSAIDEFLDFNRGDGVSPTILWEKLKVVIRVNIISYKSMLNKCTCLE